MVALKMSGLVPVSVGGAVTWKSHPVPVSGIVCGLPPALSVTVNVPARAPTTVGANVTLIVQVPPASNVAGPIGQAVAPVLVAAKSPEAAIELIVKEPLPVFVNVTGMDALVVVSICGVKGRLGTENPTPGAVADPEPLRFTLNTCVLACPPFVTTAVITRVADSAAATDGVNVTLTVHCSPAATPLGLQPSEEIAKSVLAAGDTPVATILVNVAVEAVLFVTTNAWGTLVAPTGWIPKLNGDGATVRVGTNVSLAT
jgi:hypothetical protein